jgi:tetratricopeptide (TPR) repeat protein
VYSCESSQNEFARLQSFNAERRYLVSINQFAPGFFWSPTGEQQYYLGASQAFDHAWEIGLPSRILWYQFRPYIAYWKAGRLLDVIDLANATLDSQGGRNVEETYWYKGHALAEQGYLTEARNAYEAALDINSNFYPAQISLDWVISLLNN